MGKSTATPPAEGSTIVGKPTAWALGVSSTGSGLYRYSDLTNQCNDTTPVLDGNWHHLVATVQPGVTNGTKYYIDGVLKQTCTLQASGQSRPVNIGANDPAYSTANGFNGSIDQVKLFNRILSANEVLAEYTAQNAGVPSGVSLGTIIAGTSNTALVDTVVQTDAGGYSLAVNQNNNLTSGAYTIPAIAGTIASPAVWSEGTTKGLGFTLSSTNATAIPGGWGSGNNYAAFPNTATTFYTRTGAQSAPDYVTLKLRLDVAGTQVAASTPYTNQISITGTMTP